tara:strand:- start:210 stop:836 length:627 start_codon:yes stop_codon:yes gene_type:complete
MKQIDTFLNVEGSGGYVAQYNQTISDLTKDIAAYKTSAASYQTAFNNWGKIAQEDAEKVFRNLSYGEYVKQCFKATSPCYGKGKTGRGNRYDDRYGKAMGYWLQWQSRLSTISTLEGQLAAAKKAKEDAEAAVNTAISQGTSAEDAEAIAKAELDRIKAETAAALAASEAEISQARAAAEANPNTKYYLIGAALLVGVTAFILIKRMK